MAEYLIQDTTLTNIANAIREKTGGTDAINVANMDALIRNLNASEYEIQGVKKAANLNDRYIYPDEGYYAMRSVYIPSVENLAPNNIVRDVTILGVTGIADTTGASDIVTDTVTITTDNEALSEAQILYTSYYVDEENPLQPEAAFGTIGEELHFIRGTTITIVSESEPINDVVCDDSGGSVMFGTSNTVVLGMGSGGEIIIS